MLLDNLCIVEVVMSLGNRAKDLIDGSRAFTTGNWLQNFLLMLFGNNVNFLKSLILEFLVLLQPTFLDLPNLLHFTLDSV